MQPVRRCDVGLLVRGQALVDAEIPSVRGRWKRRIGTEGLYVHVYSDWYQGDWENRLCLYLFLGPEKCISS